MWVLTVFGETYNSLAMAREQQERQEDAIAFGQIERAFQCPVSGAGVAERVPGDRLQQERQGASTALRPVARRWVCDTNVGNRG